MKHSVLPVALGLPNKALNCEVDGKDYISFLLATCLYSQYNEYIKFFHIKLPSGVCIRFSHLVT